MVRKCANCIDYRRGTISVGSCKSKSGKIGRAPDDPVCEAYRPKSRRSVEEKRDPEIRTLTGETILESMLPKYLVIGPERGTRA